MPNQRLSVLKTYKLFIGGKFPRTESGRYMTATNPKDGTHLAHYCHTSRKDFRDAVVAARSAFPGWRNATAYLRGQILYRAAEMIESRADSFASEISQSTPATPAQAKKEVEASIDRLVHFAGWTDKYGQIFSSVNPVASSHFNFSTPDPSGIVVVLAPDDPGLLGLVSLIGQVILSGNTCVAIASETVPLPALALSEALATSDLPGGVVNILTGRRDELAPWISGHMDVNGIIDGSGKKDTLATLQEGAAKNLKRVHDHSFRKAEDWFGDEAASPYRILDSVETKTAWHPMGV